MKGGVGRPRRFCKTSCRQRDYEARRRAKELGLGEDELIVARSELEYLRDRHRGDALDHLIDAALVFRRQVKHDHERHVYVARRLFKKPQ